MILNTVRFPHEKLDARHAKSKEFDTLPFNQLIAGELEIIGSDIPTEEKEARINIAKTLCYHKSYLQDDDLRDRYDQIMKRIERGQQSWSAPLREHLNELLDYRANLIVQTKIAEAAESNKHNEPFTKVEKREKDRKKESDIKEKIIYCQDYNNNRCQHNDHHDGRFAGRTVTRWHLCKKCLEVGDRRSHRAMDPECPSKTA